MREIASPQIVISHAHSPEHGHGESYDPHHHGDHAGHPDEAPMDDEDADLSDLDEHGRHHHHLHLLTAAAMLYPGMGKEFLPTFNEGRAITPFASAPGTSLQRSNAVGKKPSSSYYRSRR